MWTQIHSLYVYRSQSYPDFTFYYAPLPKYAQKKRRSVYRTYQGTYQFMANIVADQLVLFEEQLNGMTYCYEWPEDDSNHKPLMDRLPEGLVIEFGAVILGWMRDDLEDPNHFMNRIVSDLEESRRL